jgi:hypothetical protein
VNDLAPALAVLTDVDRDAIVRLADELRDAWTKRQVFRTDTEARISVLNDGSCPTPASKYWQAVREQTSMLDSLVALSFDMRRGEVRRKRLAEKLQIATDPLDRAEAQIDLDEAEWGQASMEQVARDRVREIQMWSQLKAEQVAADRFFDTTSPNTHQAHSLMLELENRRATLTPGSSQSEVINVLGPLQTVRRLYEFQSRPIEPDPLLAGAL